MRVAASSLRRLAGVTTLVVIAGVSSPATTVSAGRAAQASASEDGRPYRGRRVIDVLARLHKAGTWIIYSSSLVTPSLIVKTEPRGRTPRQVATEILAPHGLTLKDGPGGTWLVVRAPGPILTPTRPRLSRQRDENRDKRCSSSST